MRACLLAAGLAACGDGPTGPEVPVIVTVTPAGRVNLNVGDTLTVRAVVQNASRTGVTFSSSQTSVATVDPTSGLVRAVGPGTAAVTATSVADPDAFASVQVNVEAARPTSVLITSLRDAAGQAVDPQNVRGVLNVNLAVEQGNAARLQVLVDSVVGCEQTFSGVASGSSEPRAAGPVSVVCPVSTTVVDSVTGTPRIFNGPASISARLLGADNRVLYTAGGRQVVLANPNMLITRVSAQRQANDAAGLRWVAGDLTVTVIPVLFDRNTTLSRIDVRYRMLSGSTALLSDTVAPFAVTFLESGPLANLTDPALEFTVSSATSAGNSGPAGITTPFRYDSQSPRPGGIVHREWIGADIPFSTTYDPSTESDAGVGRIRPRFYAGDPSLSSEELVQRGREVAQGSDLPQASRDSYRLAVRVCDALENCVVLSGFRFGVDRTPPVVDSASFANQAVNPRRDLVFQNVRDDLSGFVAAPLEVVARRLDVRSATAVCGPIVEGIDLPGKLVNNVCVPDTLPNLIPVPREAAGYYTYQVTPFDRAGNRGAAITRNVLVDLQPPSVGPVAVTVPPNAGEPMTVTAEVSDNLDLVSAAFRLVYPLVGGGRIALPFNPDTTVGTAFDATLTTSAVATGRFPFVRTLTFGSATAGVRATVVVDSVQAAVTDAALLSASTTRRIAPTSAADSLVADPFPRFTTASTRVDRVGVCTQRCGANEPTSLRVTVGVVGEAGANQPFAGLYFYRMSSNGSVVLLGPPVSQFSTTESGSVRTFQYQLDYTPPVGLAGNFVFFAVGVSSRGGALSTALSAELGAPRVEFYTR